MNISFKKYTILILVFLSTFLLLILYSIYHITSKDAIVIDKINDYEAAINTINYYLDKFIEEKLTDLNIIISIYDHKRGKASEHIELEKILSNKPEIKYVIFTDREGSVIDLLPKKEDILGVDISHSPIFKGADKSEIYGPYVTFLDKTPYYVISKTHRDLKVFALIDIPGINSLIEILKQQEYYAFIVDSKGLVIFHVDEKLVKQGLNLSHNKSIKESLTDNSKKLIETELDGISYILMVKRIPQTDYFLFVGTEKKKAFLSLYSLRENLLMIFIFLIFISILLSLIISKKFTKPLEKILEMIEMIKKGEYKIARINSKINELDKISNQLYEMAQTISDRELKLRKIFETSTDAMIITTLDGLGLEFNDAAARMFGFKGKEDVPSDMKMDSYYYVNLNDRNFIFEQLFEKGYVKNYEVAFKKIDGNIFYGLISSSLVKDESGNVLFIVSIIKDITDKRKLQEQLFQSQKMESIGRLAGSIAHDFNNILSVIHSSNQLIQIHTKNDPKIERYTSAITGGVEKARDFIRKLLAFSKRQVFVPTVCELNEIIKEEIKLLKPTIREDIKIELKTCEYPLYVKLDRTNFTQVLMNLTINSMDAMPNGGLIVISTEAKHFEYEQIKNYPYVKEGNFATIIFTDTGIGIPDDIRDKIFEPFFTTKPEGTGLGLATVYTIIQQHNGFIEVDSEVGKGTTFKIYLPLTTQSTELLKVKAEDSGINIKKILLVEDNDDVRIMTEELLKNNGFEVLSFSNGSEVIENFDSIKEQIDLCLFDVIMPQIGGLELYRRLKLIKPDLKVVFMTGYSESLTQIRSLIEEGQQLIYKPFGITELKRKIRELFQ